MTGSNNFLSFAGAPELFLSSQLNLVSVAGSPLGKQLFPPWGCVFPQRLFQENKIKIKGQLVALRWLLMPGSSPQWLSLAGADIRLVLPGNGISQAGWDFVFIYSSREQPPELSFAWCVMGLGLYLVQICYFISEGAAGRLHSSILEVDLYLYK